MRRQPYTGRHFWADCWQRGYVPALATLWKERAADRALEHQKHGTQAPQGWWDRWLLGAQKPCTFCYTWIDKRATVCPQCHRDLPA